MKKKKTEDKLKKKKQKKKKKGLGGSYGHVVLDGKDGHFCPIKIYILMLNLGDLMDFLLNISLI